MENHKQLLADIATQLSFTIVSGKLFDHGAEMQGPNGNIWIRFDPYGKKGEASLCFPNDENNKQTTWADWFYSSDGPYLEIGFSKSKGAEKIANDIKKRLLPKALPKWQEVNKRLTDRKEFKTKKDKMIQRVETVLGRNKNKYNNEIGYYELKAKVNSGDSISIEINSMQPEHAIKVLEFANQFITD